MNRMRTGRYFAALALGAVALSIACGGSEVTVATAVPIVVADPNATATPVDYSKGISVPIPAAGYITSVATPTPEDAVGTPTPTPPPVTLGEKITAVLIDTLEATPRTSARQIVSEYRDGVAAADLRYRGKAMVIQGTVREAGFDSNGKPYVLFAAGAGALRCTFAEISRPELLRLTPGGTNAAVGTVESFDPDTLVATASQCKLVLGY